MLLRFRVSLASISRTSHIDLFVTLTKLTSELHYSGDNLRVLNGTADAYLATFSSGAGVKAEPGSDGEEDEDSKPSVKRKISKVKAEAKPKDAKKVKQTVLKFE